MREDLLILKKMIRDRLEINLKPYEESIKKQYPFLTEKEAKELTFELYKFLENRYYLEVSDLEN